MEQNKKIIFVTMIFAAIYAICVGNTFEKTFIDIIIHTLLIQMWIPNSKYYATLNGPAWYLCASFFIYLCFPLILKVFKNKISKGKVIILMLLSFIIQILIALITIVLNNHDNNAWFCTQWFTYYFPPIRLIDFFIGCCLGYVFLKKGNSKNIKNIYLIEIVICILIILSFLVYMFDFGILGSKSVKYTLLFSPTTVALIWIVSNQCGFISKLLSMKVFIKLGDLSPYTFLIHGIAIKYCNIIFQKIFLINNRYIISLFSFIVTIVATILWIKLNECFKRYKQEKLMN